MAETGQANKKHIALEVASMIYYDKTKATPDRKKFEEMDTREQKVYIDEAVNLFHILDKLGKRIIDKKDAEESKEMKAKNVDTLTQIIKTFVKGVKHPKGVETTFPCRELAFRILNA